MEFPYSMNPDVDVGVDVLQSAVSDVVSGVVPIE
ncbi:hypothetical protein PR003_g28445 [Phytophthora rubi]|uniref:Uncharacterized protein n=1 Tax=Phytophthora rubi TaxID=129364 RepID=A0A6A3HR32_9STRA|nr:hypothetical protein PR002_g27323 [Phytophthora rubi]KAE8970884.1 hypothetical protein PR001_g27072 [Phytophthora rubi]KAE9278703.1 hypothetical protein PR003_g28445 [Phytophthora rubi]